MNFLSAKRVWLLAFSLTAAILLVVLSVSSQNALQVGYAVLTASPGSPVPVAAALFSFTNSSGVLVWEAGVGAVEPILSGRIFVDQKGTRTAIALANASEQRVSATLILRDVSGKEINRVARALDRRQHLALFVDELFAGLPDGFNGSLTFETSEASQKLAAIALRASTNVRGEDVFATLPLADLSAPPITTSIVIPHIGAGTNLSTQIVLVNPTSQRISGLIQLFRSDGTPLSAQLNGVTSSQFAYQIEPNGTYRGELTSFSADAVGFALVTADQGVAPSGSAIFQFKTGDKVVSEAGVAANRPTTLARIFVDNAATRTGVAVANANSSATKVTFNLLNRNGTFLDSRERGIPARGHVAIFTDELFSDLPAGFTGLLEISSPVSVVPVTLKLTINNRNEPILTTLPIADLTQASTTTSLVLPQIGFGPIGGGDFSSRLILISKEKTRLSSGSLAFYQSNGTNMIVPVGGQISSQFSYQLSAGGSQQLRPANTFPVKDIVVDLSNPSLTEIPVNEGNAVQLAPVAIDSNGGVRDDFDFSYSSISPEIASVDAAGNIKGNKAGFSTLTVSSGGVPKILTITVEKLTLGSSDLK